MTSKNCSKCHKIKPLSCFHKLKQSADGYNYHCKSCVCKKAVLLTRTKKGLITKIYCNQLKSSARRNHNPPSYTLKELTDWALSQDIFHNIYNAWVESSYNKMMSPSFDRENDYLPYTLKTLTVMTWQENKNKVHSDMQKGINNKNSKPVIKLTLDGLFISKYFSVKQAERETSIANQNISKCCKGKLFSAGGFRWIHSLENEIANNITY